MKFTYVIRAALAGVCVALFLGGCSSVQTKAGDPDGSLSDGSADRYSNAVNAVYKIQPGDKLHISVYNEEELDKDIIVRPDGGITFPLAGDVQAKGRSIPELRTEITSLLSQYIPDATVSVSLQEVIGNKIFVLGQVKSPGEYVLTGGTDVLQALSMAGGLTAFANSSKIKILRRNRETHAEEVIPFSYKKIMRGEGLDQNITLRSGDTVIVP